MRGITAAADNLTDATGLQFEGEQTGGLLGDDYRSQSGNKVVNIAGCPTHPDWVTETLTSIAMNEHTDDDLDELARPRMYADHLVHHGCNRNEFYEYKASAESLGDRGCMMENTGCKGTQAHADCNIRPWNGQGSCTPKVAGIPVGLPTDMPKAWFVALASLSKAATPNRLKQNAVSDQLIYPPTIYKRDK